MGGKLPVILRENWDEYSYLYQKNIRKNVFDEVEKVLKCKDIIKYKCTKCNLEEDIPKEVVEYFDEMDQSIIKHLFSTVN